MHNASKQVTRDTTNTSANNSPTAQATMNESRSIQGNEQSPNNADAMNQLSTAPPGTGPPPSLNSSAEMNTQSGEPNQTNGK